MSVQSAASTTKVPLPSKKLPVAQKSTPRDWVEGVRPPEAFKTHSAGEDEGRTKRSGHSHLRVRW